MEGLESRTRNAVRPRRQGQGEGRRVTESGQSLDHEASVEIRPVESRHGPQLGAGPSVLLDCILSKLFRQAGTPQTGAAVLVLGCSEDLQD